MLRWRVFPLLRRAINLYLHYLELGPDGKYHLPLTRSCEYGCDHDVNQEVIARMGFGDPQCRFRVTAAVNFYGARCAR